MKPGILEYLWMDLCSRYSDDQQLIAAAYAGLVTAYSGPARYYHNLGHIQKMISGALLHDRLICNKDAVLFAIFFHDAVYDAAAKDNEEQSAAKATGFLERIAFRREAIIVVEQLILATKKHMPDHNPDTGIFLDFDLQILGAEAEVYKEYVRNIRKEYAVCPDEKYREGRKKVLLHFLEKPFIFCTDTFREEFELAARSNIENEIATL